MSARDKLSEQPADASSEALAKEAAGTTNGAQTGDPASAAPRSRGPRVDRELEEFRSCMEVPSSFADGFNWASLAGALFIAVLMVPGALYMGLLAGQGIGPAAQWVTVILFIEVARRAQRSLKRAEIFVLFFMAGAAMGMPFSGLLWNQFYLRSDAAAAYGIADQLPRWFAPDAASASGRTAQARATSRAARTEGV